MLHQMMATQLELQRTTFGIDPARLEPDARATFFQEMTLGATDELHEALAHVGWKGWAMSRHFERDACATELVDALTFIMGLLLACGWNADDVYKAYMEKASINARRQVEGHSGVRS